MRASAAGDFDAAVNEQVRLIFEQQNRRIAEMADEIRLLRSQVETLTRETEEVHRLRGQVETLTQGTSTRQAGARQGAGHPGAGNRLGVKMRWPRAH